MKNITRNDCVYNGRVSDVVRVFFIRQECVFSGAERETFLSEIGEGLGGVGLWLLLFMYGRTVSERGSRTTNSSGILLPSGITVPQKMSYLSHKELI